MNTQCVWDEIKVFMAEMMVYVPGHLYVFNIENFVCTRAQFGLHGLTLLKHDDDDFCTNICWHKEHPFFDVLIDDKKERVIVTEDMIYKQPSLLAAGTPYPVFHEHWKRDSEGRGVLEFFRIDLSLETFVYYERKNGFSAVKQGNLNALTSLPNSISGLDSVLHKTISWGIDFEKMSKDTLKKSFIPEFVALCKAHTTIN